MNNDLVLQLINIAHIVSELILHIAHKNDNLVLHLINIAHMINGHVLHIAYINYDLVSHLVNIPHLILIYIQCFNGDGVGQPWPKHNTGLPNLC